MFEQVKEELKKALAEAEELISSARTIDALRQAESRLTGKDGSLGKLLSSIGKLTADVRGIAGKEINLAKKQVVEKFAAARDALQKSSDQQAVAAAQTFDPTL